MWPFSKIRTLELEIEKLNREVRCLQDRSDVYIQTSNCSLKETQYLRRKLKENNIDFERICLVDCPHQKCWNIKNSKD